MPQPYKPVIPGDWRALENIIQELYRILDVDTTLTDVNTNTDAVTSDLVIVSDALSDTESEQAVISNALSDVVSDIIVLKSDIIVNASDMLLAAGNDTEVQYNNGGVRAGDATFNFNNTTKAVTADGLVLTGTIATGLQMQGLARIKWTKKAANGATVTGFTTGSNVTDLQSIDANTYTCTEVTGTPNYLIVDFAGVTAFNWVQILADYDGTSQHNIVVQLEVTPFDGSAWVTYDTIPDQVASTHTFENYSFFVEDDTPYINGGVVKVRFSHSATTSNGHVLNFNIVALHQ